MATTRTHMRFLLPWLMAIAMGFLCACTSQGSRDLPKAQKGVLDLRNWNVGASGVVPLNGEWRFHWKQLIDPADSAMLRASEEYFQLPGSWNETVRDGEKLGAEGYATMSLDVLLPDHDQLWGIKSRSVNTAWRIWVDGQEVGGAGQVGESKSSMTPATMPRTLAFQPSSDRIHIVVQVSNFYHRKGGFWWPLQIGHWDQIQAARERGVAIDLFLLGALLIMGIYHLGLFMLRPKDKSPLYFGVFSILVGTRMLFVNETFYEELFPWLPWAVAKKVEYAVTFTLTPLFFLFLNRLYPKEFPRLAASILIGFNGLLLLVAILAPAPFFTLTPTVFNLVSMPVFAFTLIGMVLTVVRRREYALPILSGTLILVLTTVNDMLNDSEMLRTGFYAPLGLFLFILIQSYVLSKRFSNAYQLAEVYAQTFQKFVPRQFLDRIAKQGIGSIKLGNAEQDDVTILFSDIRAFTTISETMTPDGVLGFLNTYLSRMEPPIRAQGGFIDKYLGDAIMALFDSSQSPKGAISAIEAALGMEAALHELNSARQVDGQSLIVCGVGLHSGSVIIGTIGGTERMDSTAIGDAVNLASRIEGLTKYYKLDILASDQVVEAPGARDRYLLRFVDKVRVVGKTVPVGIWQVVGRKGDPQWKQFEAAMPDFEAALARYFEREFDAARQQFEALAAQLPGDPLVRMYMDRCTQFSATPPESGWSGVMEMTGK